ncbi:Gmad2 immunoglobulin-like domain-containing protein [Paenibacillus harenae]|uniref:Gmad2 immunoglobulin-like domain-containing protein n=1 Tax=Paenibacillus harenae TaxID=306543 RepID=UPI00041F3E50|nr:Gmad2 immunoglobulin-like domain-containing protein [Paenibacillus harenae]
MGKRKGSLLLVLLCMASLLAACGQGNGSANPGEEPTAVKIIDKGRLIQKEAGSWLITAYVEKEENAYIDAYWFTMNEQTVLENSSGQSVSPDNIPVGAQLDAWHTGEVRESYPAQTDAAKIVVFEETQAVQDDMISESEAVQAALHSSSGSTFARAVKNAALDADKGIWSVELAEHETADQPAVVQIDARTGKLITAPVAVNEAFRVFSPEPGTESGPSFTVEGEARVFEAAFSWTLEDGHNILAEGHEMADMGAPEWGRFQFEVSYEKASQPNMMLILFVHSAKDGSTENELIIPLKVPEELIQYSTDTVLQ